MASKDAEDGRGGGARAVVWVEDGTRGGHPTSAAVLYAKTGDTKRWHEIRTVKAVY